MILPLKQLREDRGITQSELSKALKISPSTVGMWEQGRRKPDSEMLGCIADYFGVTTDYLLGRDEKSISLSRKQTTLLLGFDCLNDEGQKLIMSILGSLNVSHTKKKKNSVIQNSENGSNYGVVGGNFSSNVTIA